MKKAQTKSKVAKKPASAARAATKPKKPAAEAIPPAVPGNKRSPLVEGAYNDFYDQNREKLLAVVRKRLQKHPALRNRQDSKRIVDTSFRKYFAKVEAMKEPPKNPEGLLFQTLYHKLADYLDHEYAASRHPSRERRGDTVLGGLASPDPSPTSVAGHRDEVAAQWAVLEASLATLEPADRELLAAVLDEKPDWSKLTLALGVSKGTLQRRKSRLLAKLKKALHERIET